MRWSALMLVLSAALASTAPRAEGITDRQLRRALRGATVAQTAALEAATAAHGEARATVKAAEQRLSHAQLAHEASLMRLDAAKVHLLAIDAERTWAESSEDRGRLADLFTEERAAAKALDWRLARTELMRLRLVTAQADLDLKTAEQQVRGGVLELVRLRTFVDLDGADAALEARIGERQASLGRAEVTRHDLVLALDRAQANVTQAEVLTDRLLP
jgi:type II secretory pathway pseudopilin PulG